MKLIIAGGRYYVLTDGDRISLNRLHKTHHILQIVSGGAMGADAAGEIWAASNGIPVRRFPAKWREHGKAAGPIRNAEMAKYADAVALFPGGRGTESMYREALNAGIQIFDFR